MALYIFLAVVCLGIGLAIGKTSPHKKRGCGRGCPTCGNRFICHPGEYPEPGKEKD